MKFTALGPWKQVSKAVQDVEKVGIDVSQNIVGRVGCGGSVRFWLDVWAIDDPLAAEFPILFNLENDNFAIVSDRLGTRGFGLKWKWKRGLMDNVESAELQSLVQMVGIPFMSSAKDS
ncbi:hypothetical protein Hanom_Chr08g00754591 [Helianthus anomalus]